MLDVTRFYIPFPLFTFSMFVVKILGFCLSQQIWHFFEKYEAECSICTTYKRRQWQENATLYLIFTSMHPNYQHSFTIITIASA